METDNNKRTDDGRSSQTMERNGMMEYNVAQIKTFSTYCHSDTTTYRSILLTAD